MRSHGQNQLKISAPHPMTETCQLILLLAALISLDSPFKGKKLVHDGYKVHILEKNIAGTFVVTFGEVREIIESVFTEFPSANIPILFLNRHSLDQR